MIRCEPQAALDLHCSHSSGREPEHAKIKGCTQRLFSLLINLFVFSANWFVVRSRKCLKMVKIPSQSRRGRAQSVTFCPQPRDIQFIVRKKWKYLDFLTYISLTDWSIMTIMADYSKRRSSAQSNVFLVYSFILCCWFDVRFLYCVFEYLEKNILNKMYYYYLKGNFTSFTH